MVKATKRLPLPSCCAKRAFSAAGWVTSEIKQVVEEQMQQDDETTAVQLHRILTDKDYCTCISLRTILRCRMSLDGRFEEVPVASISMKVTK